MDTGKSCYRMSYRPFITTDQPGNGLNLSDPVPRIRDFITIRGLKLRIRLDPVPSWTFFMANELVTVCCLKLCKSFKMEKYTEIFFLSSNFYSKDPDTEFDPDPDP
jgi:hypothetical protein